MSEELKDIMKKIEELRDDINKMVVDNSLGDMEVINKSRVMDWHLNRYQELINFKNKQLNMSLEKKNEKKNLDEDQNAEKFKYRVLENNIDIKKNAEESLIEDLELDIERLILNDHKEFLINNQSEKNKDKHEKDLEQQKLMNKNLQLKLELEIDKQLANEFSNSKKDKKVDENMKENKNVIGAIQKKEEKELKK